MGRSLRVEADGGSRGNPGVAGYGALVRDAASGALLVELAEPLGRASNNVAEYRGMLAGLRAAQQIDPGADVEVAMDSKLVVEQMSGRWKIKHPDMRELALQGRETASQISAAGGSVSYTWIPRAENSDADALSNRGMDGDHVEDWHLTDAAGSEARKVPEERPEAVGPGAVHGEPTRVVLVRHGGTALTDEGRADGAADPPLSPAGRRRATRAADLVAGLVGPARARVITSARARARETGELVTDRLGVESEATRDWDEQRPGESHEEVMARVGRAWQRVVAGGGTAVVVSHRTPILAVLSHVLGLSHEHFWQFAAAPGSLTAIEAQPDGTAVIAFTNHH